MKSAIFTNDASREGFYFFSVANIRAHFSMRKCPPVQEPTRMGPSLPLLFTEAPVAIRHVLRPMSLALARKNAFSIRKIEIRILRL